MVSPTQGNWTSLSAGASGSTVNAYSVNVATHLAGLNPPDQPIHVLINLGVNDMLGGLGAQATFEANYLTIVDAVHTKWPQSKIWLSRPWARNELTDANTVATWLANVAAARSGYTFVGDDERVWLENGDDGATRTTDGIHYSTPAGMNAKAAATKTALGY